MQLVFNRDVIHNVSFHANWKYIRERKQRLIVQNNKNENKKRMPYTCKVGDLVSVKLDPSTKHGTDRYKGPFEVIRVCSDNGMVRLKKPMNLDGHVEETWNIWNLYPYKA